MKEEQKKLYQAGMRSYDAAGNMKIVERQLESIDEEHLAEKASKLQRQVEQLHREIDEKVGEARDE